MIIISVNKIRNFRDLAKRVEKAEKQYKKTPDAIIVETKTAFNDFCNLLNGKPMNEKGFYNYTFRGIPLILPWQIRI